MTLCTITSIRPCEGPPIGGTIVVLTGTGFMGVTGVKFGGTAATSYSASSDTQMTAVSPAGTGQVDITVQNSTGWSYTVNADLFTYIYAQSVMRPDTRVGPPISGMVDGPNGASSPQVILIAHDFTYHIHVPTIPNEIVGQPLDFLEFEPRLMFTVIGEFQSGILAGTKYYGAGGGPLTLKLNSGHTVAGTAHLTSDDGRFIRWAIWGRSLKTMRFLPSYAHRTVRGYLTSWTETCNGNT